MKKSLQLRAQSLQLRVGVVGRLVVMGVLFAAVICACAHKKTAQEPSAAQSESSHWREALSDPMPRAVTVPVNGEEPNPGRASIEVGGTCFIRLPGNATTGYMWELSSLDRTIAEPVGSGEYVPDQNPKGMVGVGGTYTVILRGVKPGKTEAVLIYRRSWEKEPPIKTFKAVIEVSEKK